MEIGPIIFLTIILVVATVKDIKFRKIPNWLTYPTMIVAIAYYTGMNGLEGLLFSLGGIAVGMAVLIPLYLMGGMGAGDVKLMGAVGGLLGPKGVLIALLCTALIGGIYAIISLAFYGELGKTIKRYWRILLTFILTKKFIYIQPHENIKKLKLCYGVAIALGTFSSIFVEGIGI
jgi:prepilin peptidase CpaA